MGWAVLYCAFGVVALWLLGEVLLQYKARLRWRLLAFGGFLGVVVGVVLPSVLVIAAGAAAFAVGQTYVTLSFRRGFATGWALRRPANGAGGRASAGRGAAGTKRRRGAAAEVSEPTLRVSDLQADGATPPPPETAPAPVPTYQPEPLPDDTDGYGIYGLGPGAAPPANAPDAGYGTAGDQAPVGDDGTGHPAYAAYAGHDAADGQHGYPPPAGDGYDGYGSTPYAGYQEQPYGAPPAHPPTDDPYAHTGALDDYGPGPLGSPDPFAPDGYAPGPHASYGQQAPAQDGYAAGAYGQDGYDQGDYGPGGYAAGAGYPGPAGYGTDAYDPGPAAGAYGSGDYPVDGYGTPQPYQDQAPGPQTPPDGIWVPQQRDGELPVTPPQPYPSYDPDQRHTGHDEQYRY